MSDDQRLTLQMHIGALRAHVRQLEEATGRGDAKIAGQHFKMIQHDVLAARRDFPEAVRELRIGYQSMGALDLYDAAAVRAHVASAVGKLEAIATTGPTRRVPLRAFLRHAARGEPVERQ